MPRCAHLENLPVMRTKLNAALCAFRQPASHAQKAECKQFGQLSLQIECKRLANMRRRNKQFSYSQQDKMICVNTGC